MSQAIVKIEYLFKKRPAVYTLIALLISMALAWFLYISLAIAKPSDVAMYFSWDTPPDVYPYRKYWAILLSTGWISLLILALLLTVCVPVYLSKRDVINNYISSLAQSLAPLTTYASTFKYIILFGTFAWLIIGGIFFYETLFKMYPPTLIGLVQQTNGFETAQQWSGYIYFLFVAFITFGIALILGPLGIASYLFFKRKGRV